MKSFPRLDAFVGSLGMSPSSPSPLVVFDCDGTIIQGDIGEAMFYRQVERFLFRVSPALLWHDHPKRTELGNLFESLAALPPDRRINDRRYGPFTELVLSWYFDQLAQGKTAKACADIVRLLAGYRTREVREIASATLRTELRATPGTRTLATFRLPLGISYIRESLDWLERLKSLGAEIWVISGSNRWSVEAVFERLNIPPERILGIDLQEDGGVLTPEVRGHIPLLQGKIDALRELTSRRPAVVFSDSVYDLPLFRHATGLRVLINSRNGTSAEFFSSAGIARDETWEVVENPTVEQQG